MNALLVRLADIKQVLESEGRRFALIGGVAVSARATPRFTQDIDVAVAVSDDHEAEELIWSLRRRGRKIGFILEQAEVGRIATVRIGDDSLGTEVVVDLLMASSGIEQEIVSAAEVLDVGGVSFPVARTGHLLGLKLLSMDKARRLRDVIDIQALLKVITHEELARTREAIALIAARGFDRGRDLVALLDQALVDAG